MTRAYLDAERLMALRKQRKMTQQDVADSIISLANVSRIEHEDDVYLRPTALTSRRSAASWRSPALPRRRGAEGSGSGQPTSISDTDTWREWADSPILQSSGEQRCKTAASTAGDRVRSHRQRRAVLFSTASCRHYLRRCSPSRASPIVTVRHRHRAAYAGSRPGPALTSWSRRQPMPALLDTSASNAPRRGHSYGGSSRCSSRSTRRAGPLAALVRRRCGWTEGTAFRLALERNVAPSMRLRRAFVESSRRAVDGHRLDSRPGAAGRL